MLVVRPSIERIGRFFTKVNSYKRFGLEDLLSHCALNCTECGAYIAGKTGDEDIKVEVIRLAAIAGHVLGNEEVVCNGCLSDDGLFGPSKHCEIRLCAKKHNTEVCVRCEDYYCNLLKANLPY